MNRAAMLAATAMLAAAAFMLYRHNQQQQSATAGDLEANFVEDELEMLNTWPSGSDPYRATIESAASLSNVPVSILAWLLWKESRYNPAIIDGRKRSPVGALGIAQFMPATARQELGSESAALDPDQAIPGAARYLKKLYSQTGTWEQALAAYNWGIGNVKKKGLANAPAETRDYYQTIMARSGTATSYA